MRILFILLGLLLTGCGSTPSKDDYVKYVNRLHHQGLSPENIKLFMPSTKSVELRGIYKRDNTVDGTPMLYQGGAGIAGLLVQIGTHSSIVNSQRQDKLAKAQEEANKQIKPLIDRASTIKPTHLFVDYENHITKSVEPNDNTFHVKPIFFSDLDITSLTLKLIIWQEASTKSRRNKFNYKNLIQVFSDTLTDEEKALAIDNNSNLLKNKLQDLLNRGLNVVLKDLTKQYKGKHTQETFIVESNNEKQVIRGSKVEVHCNYDVVKTLHSWYMVLPHKSNESKSCDGIKTAQLNTPK